MKICVIAVAMVLCAASSAQAAPWKQVTTADQTSIDQVGLLRTPDGALHVAWHRPTGPNTDDLLHTLIAPNGTVGATTPIQTGWTGFQNAALVQDPGGIRLFVGAIRSTDSSDPQDELNTLLSSDGGATWTLQPGNVVPDGGQAYGSPVAATTLPGGGTLQAWAGTLGTWVHAGLSPATPNHDYQAPIGTYGYDPNLATDASGRTVLAWYSNAAGHLGVLAQDVAADGSPVGSAVTMPGTDDMRVGMIGRTPIVARAGGGLYVAYPTGYPTMDRVRLWRVGSGSTSTIARLGRTGSKPVTIAAAADGRLWVVWVNTRGGVPHVLAQRSNRTASRFGATVDAGRPGRSPVRLPARGQPHRRRARRARQLQHRDGAALGHLHPQDPARAHAAGQTRPPAPRTRRGRALRRERRGRSGARRPREGRRRIRPHRPERERDASTPGAHRHRQGHEAGLHRGAAAAARARLSPHSGRFG